MTAESLLESLFRDVPEMRGAVNYMLKLYQIEPTAERFPVWEHGVLECVEVMLENRIECQQVLKRIFSFFEKLANGDEETRNFFLVATMDFFYKRQELLPIASEFMGPSTKAAWQTWYQFQKDSLLLELSQLYSDEELEAMKQV